LFALPEILEPFVRLRRFIETYRIWLEFAEQVLDWPSENSFCQQKNEASSAVKNKPALKQSIASVLAFAIAAMLVLAVKYPSSYTIVPLGIFAIFLFIDAMIIREELTRRGVVRARRNGCFPRDVHSFCARFRVTKKGREHQMNCALKQLSTGASACSRSDRNFAALRRDRSCRVF
jgi:hypothetical protein